MHHSVAERRRDQPALRMPNQVLSATRVYVPPRAAPVRGAPFACCRSPTRKLRAMRKPTRSARCNEPSHVAAGPSAGARVAVSEWHLVHARFPEVAAQRQGCEWLAFVLFLIACRTTTGATSPFHRFQASNRGARSRAEDRVRAAVQVGTETAGQGAAGPAQGRATPRLDLRRLLRAARAHPHRRGLRPDERVLVEVIFRALQVRALRPSTTTRRDGPPNSPRIARVCSTTRVFSCCETLL